MSQPLKALIVEDNENDAELLVLALEQGGFQVEFQRVDTPQKFREALDSNAWQMIFSDHSMPHFNSFQALEIRNQRLLDIPFIILSGTMGEDLAVDAMRAGASDYFVKGNLKRLIAAVNRELHEAKERSDLRKTEWELEHFMATLTHDLRTPILAELRVLELLQSGTLGSLNHDQYEVIQELVQSNHFVQHMVNNILYAYKYKQHKVRLEPEYVDLAQFISASVNSIAIRTLMKEKSHELIMEPAESLPKVEIDRNEMQRVVLNLIKNAADYTPRGGTITVSAEWHGDFVRVGVQDTGPGVAPEIEPYLFTPYATSAVKKYRQLGMGLGLFLSRQIVEAHYGRIGYEKKRDGSFFYFEIPLAHQWEASPAANLEKATA